MEKKCLVCGWDCASSDSTCPKCGEASFVDAPVAAPAPAKKSKSDPKPDAKDEG